VIIRCALEQARKWGLVERNVADDALPPPNSRPPDDGGARHNAEKSSKMS
jgi:hypothetical protein